MINQKEILKYWHRLSLHEQRTISLGSVIVAALIAYTLIWSPIANKVVTLREQIVKDGKILTWMQSADTKIQLMEKHLQNAHTNPSQSLLSLIQEQINQSPLAKNVSGLRQLDKDAIELNLNKISFDEMIKWVTQLWQKQGIQVTHMNAVPTGETGMVNAEIGLKA